MDMLSKTNQRKKLCQKQNKVFYGNALRTFTCKNCQKSFTKRVLKKVLFCSRECFNNLRIYNNSKGIKLNKKCKICNKVFSKLPYLSWVIWGKRKFCSEKCFGKSIKGKNSHQWKNGLSRTKEMINYYTRQRSYRKKNAIGSHSFQEWENLKVQYNWTCPCCRKPEPEIKLTEDHIVPLIKNGSNDIGNIQPLCISCNSIKKTKVIKYEKY